MCGLILGTSAARSADQFLRQADCRAITLAVSYCRGFWNKMDKVRASNGARHPLAKSSLPGGRTEKLGRNPNSGQPMLAPGDHGPGSSSVLLRNPDASEQRYTDPHGVDPVHGGA